MKRRLYGIWYNMKYRCDNPKAKHYNRYGGRGITYCNEWESFNNFFDWAISSGYKDTLTLDRINFDSNYIPNNCRWVTRKEQSHNTSNNNRLLYNGEYLLITQIADILGVTYQTLQYRIKNKPKDTWFDKPLMDYRKVYVIGNQTGTMKELCLIYNIKPTTVRRRLHNGWTEFNAFTVPTGKLGVTTGGKYCVKYK